MRYAYPCDIVRDPEEESEAYVVTFPDVYGATTGGWSWDEAVEMAEDALAAALAMYVRAREDVPTPSPLAVGQVMIPVPVLAAAKLSLNSAMREQGITNVALATRLGLTENAVRRLVDPDHRSHIGQVQKALRVVGRTLVLEDAGAINLQLNR
jgi:antitoxin HicB